MKETFCEAILCCCVFAFGCNQSSPQATAKASDPVNQMSSNLVFNVEGLT